jgi:hypothetical protein
MHAYNTNSIFVKQHFEALIQWLTKLINEHYLGKHSIKTLHSVHIYIPIPALFLWFSTIVETPRRLLHLLFGVGYNPNFRNSNRIDPKAAPILLSTGSQNSHVTVFGWILLVFRKSGVLRTVNCRNKIIRTAWDYRLIPFYYSHCNRPAWKPILFILTT